MQRMLRGAGMAIVILSSIATAFTARDRGALFWGSIATTVGAAVVLWRILNERGAE